MDNAGLVLVGRRELRSTQAEWWPTKASGLRSQVYRFLTGAAPNGTGAVEKGSG